MAVDDDHAVQKTNFSKRRQSSEIVRVGKPIYIWRWLIHDTHSWMTKSLELVGSSKNIVNLLIWSMKKWEINLICGNIDLEVVKINRWIFQADSLSPLLFVV